MLSATSERRFFGKFPASDPAPERSTGNAFDFEGLVHARGSMADAKGTSSEG